MNDSATLYKSREKVTWLEFGFIRFGFLHKPSPETSRSSSQVSSKPADCQI
jgi:hypothetical protein